MLENTFAHVPGIGAGAEKRLWVAGIHDWGAFKEPYPLKLSSGKLAALKRHLPESEEHLRKNRPEYFVRRLPSGLHWRLFPEFRHTAVYLDIETTGLDRHENSITTIALYDGYRIFHYVKDQNLEDFKDRIRQYALIISYNGKCFDVPFIESALGIRLPQAHIDLRYVLAGLGLKGGLKRCETLLGMDRVALSEVDGFFAVLLWEDYQKTADPKALETLLAYNIQDAVSLEALMVTAYNLKIRDTPFAEKRRLPLPEAPCLPFEADKETIARIRRRYDPYAPDGKIYDRRIESVVAGRWVERGKGSAFS